MRKYPPCCYEDFLSVFYGAKKEPLSFLSEQTAPSAIVRPRVSSFISELDMLGLVNSKRLYKGRQRRMRLVTSNVPKEKVDGLLAG